MPAPPPNLPHDGPLYAHKPPDHGTKKQTDAHPSNPNRSTQLAGATSDISGKNGEGAMRTPLHEKWKDEIKRYFDENGLDYSKLLKMSGCYDKTITIYQYVDWEKEIDWETFRDDIPAPAVFIGREEDGRPVFEETGITRKYLSRSPE